jgi:hypothetical protein
MRLRPSPEWEPLFAALTTLKKSWPTRGFSWDARLVCVTSSFAGEFTEPARDALRAAFPYEFGPKNVGTAHPSMLEVVEKAGGIRSGQYAMAMSQAPTAHLMVWALWWPWNDQETVSVRLGLARLESNDDPYPRFRDVFGVSGY